MKSLILSFVSLSEGFSTEYSAKTRYIQRNAKKQCSKDEISLPTATACLEEIYDGDQCQVTCHQGFQQFGNGNFECSCFIDYGPIRIAKDDCEWIGDSNFDCYEEGVSMVALVNETATCDHIPELDHGSWLCPGMVETATDLTVCTAECDQNYIIQTHPSTQEFTCVCDADRYETSCRWEQNPRAKNLHVDLVNNDTDLSIFSDPIVWPVCQEIGNYDEGNLESCPDLPTVDGGYFRCRNHYYVHSKCYLECNPGYVAANTALLPVLQCKKNQRWSRPVVEECLTIASAVQSQEVSFCPSPHGQTEEEKKNSIGEYKCNVQVDEKQHYFDGVTCELSCPIGFKLKREDDRKTCQCTKAGCRWLRQSAVECILDKFVLRNSFIWDSVKDLPTLREQADFIRNHFSEFQRMSVHDIRDMIIEKASARRAQLRRRANQCGPLQVDSDTTTVKCNGNSPGSTCLMKCKKPFKLPKNTPKRTFCICNRRCRWTHQSSCL